ncbi:MAG: sarcosine oxidase subunit delta, partial [Hyphomicrobiales bacterium]
MLLIRCQVCGVEGEEGDFHYGGEAHVRRPASHDPGHVTDLEQRDYLFMRHNP